MFLDVLKLSVKAGRGGDGSVSFRREKYVPKGGPDGGDGGNGGSIILKTNPQLTTLADYHYKRGYKAKAGQSGMGNKRFGRKGEDIVIPVPPGTVVKEAESGRIIVDLVEPYREFIIARGGKGGRGNVHFATPSNQTPRRAENGRRGEEKEIILEVKLIADIGLVGKPNAGKSTLLSVISHAKPEIADYPFTTLRPYLGIVKWREDKSFVVADIPGLIEGAHQGKGLGHQFLKHIERTRAIAFIVDGSNGKIGETVKMLKAELSGYSELLAEKPAVLVLTKKDSWPEDLKLKGVPRKIPKIEISSVTGLGLDKLKDLFWKLVEDNRPHSDER
jgi:GTP-binding protein